MVKPTLTDKRRRFVEEYLVDLNATQAAVRSGYSERTANEQGARLLANASVAEAIAAAQAKRSVRTQITADRALEEVWAIATADARELVQVKVGACRYCFGAGHRYQRTIVEMGHDRRRWESAGEDPALFDSQGGVGFNIKRAPNPECPECGGDGQPRTVLADTRNLSPRAATLYAGAKQTKYGIEVLTHQKADALTKVFRHLGLFEKDNAQRGSGIAEFFAGLSGNVIGPTRTAADLGQDDDDPG